MYMHSTVCLLKLIFINMIKMYLTWNTSNYWLGHIIVTIVTKNVSDTNRVCVYFRQSQILFSQKNWKLDIEANNIQFPIRAKFRIMTIITIIPEYYFLFSAYPLIQEGGGSQFMKCIPNTWRLEPLPPVVQTSPFILKQRIGCMSNMPYFLD